MSESLDPFPKCIREILATSLMELSGVASVRQRELSSTDTNGDIGISYAGCRPVEYEMSGGPVGESITEYTLLIEHLVKNSAREAGEDLAQSVARNIRSMLAHNDAMRVALASTFHVAADYRERMLAKWSVEQRFADNKIGAAFVFLSVTSFTFYTDTTP